MKQMKKLKYGEKVTLVSNGELSAVTALGTLELQLKYVDELGNHVDINCGVVARANSLPKEIISRINGFLEIHMHRAKNKYPRPVNVDLSHKEINTLINTSSFRNKSNTPADNSNDNITKESYDQNFMKKIGDLMKANLSDDTYCVDKLAHDAHVSRSTLFRKLKNITGKSPQEYMRTQRLQKAIGLMEQGPLRISEVAYQVGFSDPNYFSKSFRKFFGISPTNFIVGRCSGNEFQLDT